MYYSLINSMSRGGASYHPTAENFFTRNSTLTDLTQKTAINQFCIDLDSYGLLSLAKYIYFGFLGNSTKCSHNLLSSSNQLTFSSGWTFDSQGMQGNGFSAYAQTSFIPSVSASQNSKTLFVYSQSDLDILGADIGSSDGNQDILIPKYSGTSFSRLSYNGPQSLTNSGTTTGMQLITRTASNSYNAYNKTTSLGTNTSASTGQSTNQDFLGAYNNSGSGAFFSSRKISIYGRMSGLNATQEANLNTCINTLLTALSIPTW